MLEAPTPPHPRGRPYCLLLRLQMGIVGLPNVGKSTLFNVLTKLSIPAENFPFCTIEPNQVCVVLCGVGNTRCIPSGSCTGLRITQSPVGGSPAALQWSESASALGTGCNGTAGTAVSACCFVCQAVHTLAARECRAIAWAAAAVLLSHQLDACVVVGLPLLLLMLVVAGSCERSR